MKCAKCGAEIQPGYVYCSRCGQEAQIVTEVNILEDDLLRAMLEEDDRKTAAEKQPKEESRNEDVTLQNQKRAVRDNAAGRRSSDKHGMEHASYETQRLEKHPSGHPAVPRQPKDAKQKKSGRNLVLLLVLLAAACAAAFGVVSYQHSHSADYQLQKAKEAFAQKNYTSTLSYLEKVFALDADNEDAFILQGKSYAMMGNVEGAESVLLEVIKKDDSCEEAFTELLELYSEEDDYDSILALKKLTADKKILALFDDYIVESPVIDKKSGTYDEFFDVTLSAEGKKLTIYYTLDGSVPTSDSEEYEEPIAIDKQGKTTLTAVCIDEQGRLSEPVTARYVIALENPDTPRVTPDGGTFTYATTVRVSVPKGITVYYTWDGSTPTENSTVYTGPMEIPEGNNILSLIAVDENGMKSEVLKCNYIYYPTGTSVAADATDTRQESGTESGTSVDTPEQ